MIVQRSMHPQWLSNSYLVADEASRNAFFVDSGAPLEPLIEMVERLELTPTHLLITHADADHIAGNGELTTRFDLVLCSHELNGLADPESAAISTDSEVFYLRGIDSPFRVEALETPGHKDDHLAFVVNGEVAFTGDVLFRDAVGGGNFQQIRDSVMNVLMELPPETRVLPGHTDETTIGREWEQNPFVRVWRGGEPEGTEPVRVGGRDATLVVWSPDYDGKGKAWVRFDDGEDAIVGGSRVERR